MTLLSTHYTFSSPFSIPGGEDFYFLYLHGLNGSPLSIKATKLYDWLTQAGPGIHFERPQLPISPDEVIVEAKKRLQSQSQIKNRFIIGTSLGGYYTRYLMEQDASLLGAILINPVVAIEELLTQIPEQQYHPYLKQSYLITDAMKQRTLAYQIKQQRQPQRYLLLLQEDDELCQAEDAQKAFPQAQHWLGEGQGHAFDNIEVTFDTITQFINNCCHL